MALTEKTKNNIEILLKLKHHPLEFLQLEKPIIRSLKNVKNAEIIKKMDMQIHISLLQKEEEIFTKIKICISTR